MKQFNEIIKIPLNKIRSWINGRPRLPYQDVWFRGSHYPGLIKTRRLFYSLDILNELPGATFTDLGCNRGGLVFLAEENGAAVTTGVDIDPVMIGNAKEIAKNENSKSVFIQEDIFHYVRGMAPVDIVTCMSVFRHLYSQLMKKRNPSFVAPKTYLTYKSMDILIRQNTGDPVEVREGFNDTLHTMMDKAEKRFICAFNDNSGLIARRQAEVENYFKSLHTRVDSIETYIYDYTKPKYVVMNIKMKSR